MGTDIHYDFQKKVKKDDREIWETIIIDDENYDSPHYIPRNYLLFSVLADVRNGTGFGGVITYKPVVPISEPRGLPDDLPRDEDGKDTSREGWCFNESEEDWYYGDHSYSHLSSEEILDYFKNKAVTTRTGIIGRSQYLNWDRVAQPIAWAGGVWAQDVKVLETVDGDYPETLADDITHVRVSWDVDICEALEFFKKMIENLVEEHGPIRMVFGFDS